MSGFSSSKKMAEGVSLSPSELGIISGFPMALRTANAEKVDLVVIPSHARKPLRQVFVGNTAEALLRRSVRPVLVLPWSYLAEYYS